MKLLQLQAAYCFLNGWKEKFWWKTPKDCEGFTPSHIAAQNRNFEVLKYIIDGVEEKCPIDNDGWTPLHSAAKRGHFEVWKYLMDLYNDKNPRANNGFTPLNGAAMNGHLKICETKIEKWGE